MSVQEPMLAELDRVLKKTYVTRADVEQFLSGVLTEKKLAGDAPCDFWKKANFLNIQSGGNSQREDVRDVRDRPAEDMRPGPQ